MKFLLLSCTVNLWYNENGGSMIIEMGGHKKLVYARIFTALESISIWYIADPWEEFFFLFFSLSLTSFKERSRKLGGIKDIRIRLCKGKRGGTILKIAKRERENNDKIIPVLSHFYTKKVTMAFKATQIIPPPKMNWFNSESITQCPVSLEKHEEAIQFTLFPNKLSKWCQIMHFRLRWQTTTDCIDWSNDHQS